MNQWVNLRKSRDSLEITKKLAFFKIIYYIVYIA